MTKELISKTNSGCTLSDIKIVDSHAHMGPYWNFHVPYGDAKGMLVSMDAVGIDSAIIAPLISIGPGFQRGNRTAESSARRYPGRFWGAIGINPNYPELAREEFNKMSSSPRMKGVKLHPSLHDYPADGEIYRWIYEASGKNDLPVTTHTWEGDKRCNPEIYGELASDYPGTDFVLVHSGGTPKGVEEAIETASFHQNIYLETCGSKTFGLIESMVDSLGSKRILFGSDMPFLDPNPQVGKVVYADIKSSQKLNILGRNAEKLFHI